MVFVLGRGKSKESQIPGKPRLHYQFEASLGNLVKPNLERAKGGRKTEPMLAILKGILAVFSGTAFLDRLSFLW